MATRPRPPFLGALPDRGPWSAVGLRRGQFLAILAVAVTVFVFLGGPVWAHVHDRHFARLAVSYGVIPPLAAVALRRNGALAPASLLGATLVIALVKLVVTAGLLVAFALAR
jgi:hypothetical protein